MCFEFTLEGALRHRERETWPQWVDAFLRGPGNNVPLANGLKLDRRWWRGPEQILLSELTPKGGPGREFNETESGWNARLRGLVEAITAGTKVPPLIAEFKDGKLLLADGNHRHGALEQIGVKTYWTAIWCNSQRDYDLLSRSR